MKVFGFSIWLVVAPYILPLTSYIRPLFLFYAPKIFFHAPVANFLYFFVLFSGYKGTAFLSPPQ